MLSKKIYSLDTDLKKKKKIIQKGQGNEAQHYSGFSNSLVEPPLIRHTNITNMT